MDINQIEKFFQSQGLECSRINDSAVRSVFVTVSSNKKITFPFLSVFFTNEFGDKYLRLSVVPFIEKPKRGYSKKFYVRIGEINHNMSQLKFAFDKDGDLELILDVKIDTSSTKVFNDLFQLLVDCTSLYHHDLLTLLHKINKKT